MSSGETDTVVCPSCGAELSADAVFCKHCGARVAQAEETTPASETETPETVVEVEAEAESDPGPDDNDSNDNSGDEGSTAALEDDDTEDDDTEDDDTEDDDEPIHQPVAAEPEDQERPRRRARRDGSGRRAQQTRGGPNYTVWIAIAAVVVIAVIFGVREYQRAQEAEGTGAVPPGPRSISGTVTVKAGLAAPPVGTLYVMTRPAGNPTAPPIAAVKIPVANGPMHFTISAADVMFEGMTFEQPMDITARWDQDGDPITREVGDLAGGTSTAVSPGATDVQLVLDEVLSEPSAAGGTGAPDSAPASAPAEEPDSAAAAPDSAPDSAAVEAPANSEPITGTIKVAEGLTPPSGGAIFVMARAPGATAGAPMAVKRLDAGPGPLKFTLGQADAMLGAPLTGKMSLQVRWDQDGNAMTKDPGDLVGALDQPVELGSDVEITLSSSL